MQGHQSWKRSQTFTQRIQALGIIHSEHYELLDCTHDVYGVNQERNDIDIQTHYEKTFRNKGKSITYTRFRLS